jgi:hypothetical protein
MASVASKKFPVELAVGIEILIVVPFATVAVLFPITIGVDPGTGVGVGVGEDVGVGFGVAVGVGVGVGEGVGFGVVVGVGVGVGEIGPRKNSDIADAEDHGAPLGVGFGSPKPVRIVVVKLV